MPRVHPKEHRWKSDFYVNKWKWYIVDLTNWHKPVLVRKHLDTKKQAINYKEKCFDKHHIIIYGAKALLHGLKDKPNLKPKNRHSQVNISKYNFPPHVITPMQKISYRVSQRRKRKRKLTMDHEDLMIIMEDQPILFQKRLKRYRDYHFAFTDPVPELKLYQKNYEFHEDIKHLSNISRCLRKYYARDIGDFPVGTVALKIFEEWRDRIKRHGEGHVAIYLSTSRVIAELYARGWKDAEVVDFDPKEDSYLETINLPVQLVYPEHCWHGINDRDYYEHYIYDFHAEMGIPNYVGVHVPI